MWCASSGEVGPADAPRRPLHLYVEAALAKSTSASARTRIATKTGGRQRGARPFPRLLRGTTRGRSPGRLRGAHHQVMCVRLAGYAKAEALVQSARGVDLYYLQRDRKPVRVRAGKQLPQQP